MCLQEWEWVAELFLIPLLTILMGVSQQVAQGVNLVVFIPLAIMVLIIYHKKKLLNIKNIWWLLVPAVIVSGAGSLLAIKIQGKILQIIFGVFWLVLGFLWAYLPLLGK